MHITFVSNYINHHQLPLSEELFRLTGGEYTFLQTEPMTEERIKMGWDPELVKKPYVKLFDDDPEGAKKLILESDAVIFGGTEKQELIIPRLEAGKFTLRYSERLYKTGRWKFISPRGLKQKRYDHTRFKKSPAYLLCAGAYVAGDFRLIGAYPKKMLKFGYFHEFIEYENVHFKRRRQGAAEKVFTDILWAGRFIDWKHPEMMVLLARRLARKGYPFHVTMVGDGEMLEEIKKEVKERKFSELFTFTGSKTPEEVRELMLNSEIFISTSDRQEGWGAVVNEAMNSGCITIAAKEIGSAPWLIEDGVNGYTYKAIDIEEMLAKAEEAISDRTTGYIMGRKAYETIKKTWNATIAAQRLYDFIADPEHKIPDYENGPLSRA